MLVHSVSGDRLLYDLTNAIYPVAERRTALGRHIIARAFPGEAVAAGRVAAEVERFLEPEDTVGDGRVSLGRGVERALQPPAVLRFLQPLHQLDGRHNHDVRGYV